MKQDAESSSLTPLAQQLLTELKAVRTKTAHDENVRTLVLNRASFGLVTD